MNYKNIHKLALVIFLVNIVSCAQDPTKSELANADYGRDMLPSECIKIAEDIVTYRFKDPLAAQFRHSSCEKGYFYSVPIRGMPIVYGWMQKGQVNGKNSYGAYVGFREYQVLIKNGQVVRYCIADDKGYCIP